MEQKRSAGFLRRLHLLGCKNIEQTQVIFGKNGRELEKYIISKLQ